MSSISPRLQRLQEKPLNSSKVGSRNFFFFWERKLGNGIVQNSCQLAEWWIVYSLMLQLFFVFFQSILSLSFSYIPSLWLLSQKGWSTQKSYSRTSYSLSPMQRDCKGSAEIHNVSKIKSKSKHEIITVSLLFSLSCDFCLCVLSCCNVRSFQQG